MFFNLFSYLKHCIQCIIPVIKNVFPKQDNKVILNLIYTLVEWHAYAKLCLHTKSTLNEFALVCRRLGLFLRKFIKTVCQKYITKELPSEISARGRREANLAAHGKPVKRKANGEPKIVTLNVGTYKAHSLSDYPEVIWVLGTTDNFTTQSMSTYHYILLCLELLI